jgi:hypothetical protein
MNKRMQSLCQKAFAEVWESRTGTDGLIRTDGNPYIFYEKFAELVVTECSSLLQALDAREEPAPHIYLLKVFGIDNDYTNSRTG